MKVVIVGAGFAGLALCWYLSEAGCEVVVFDRERIGEGGASSIAAGLVHPYPGEQARRSWKAEESMQATRSLLSLAGPVFNEKGIIRYALNESQREHLVKRCHDYNDIEQMEENAFFIRSGMTVYAQAYLEGLWKACEQKGAIFQQKEPMLQEYDHIVYANGVGLCEFPELKLKRVKGQVLKCHLPEGLLTHSIVGKGYVALGERAGVCYVGATFERESLDGLPHLEEAKTDLFSKIRPFFPEIDQLNVLECRAAYRVVREGTYLPLIQKMGPNQWAFGAFGSRGLLYHAFFAQQLRTLLLQ